MIELGFFDEGPLPDCPSWCAGEHPQQAGVTHTRSAGLQAVVARTALTLGPQATEFDVLRFQGADDTEEWVFVGDDAQGFVITTESAARIFRALGDILTSAGH